ncbi:MAG: hypothetical protein M1826_001921 [Phylliscum demangeonii]|nr:MAG: hypothetical protein M1826_001921 [Phylliscum demangeonii]
MPPPSRADFFLQLWEQRARSLWCHLRPCRDAPTAPIAGKSRGLVLQVRALPSPTITAPAQALAATATANVGADPSFNHLFASFTLTAAGLESSNRGGIVTDRVSAATNLPTNLAIATGAPPPPAVNPTAPAFPAATATATASTDGGAMNKNTQHLLIAVGCVAAFVVLLCVAFIVHRARRRASASCWGCCLSSRKKDSLYREIESGGHGWEAKTVDGAASDRKDSFVSRSAASTPTLPSPHLRTPSLMTPAPLRLNSTFIGRERNTLVRASLNRHQLSTLDEHLSYEHESDAFYRPTPPPVPMGAPSLAQQISRSARDVRLTATAAHARVSQPAELPAELPAMAALQRLRTPSREASPPPTPQSGRFAPPAARLLLAPPPPTAARFRSVDHWTDYQRRMAERDRSMTSGEYSQAFKDRNSAADSTGTRDSNSTIAVFRYHPGDEVSFAARAVDPAGGHPPAAAAPGAAGADPPALARSPPPSPSSPPPPPPPPPPPIPPVPTPHPLLPANTTPAPPAPAPAPALASAPAPAPTLPSSFDPYDPYDPYQSYSSAPAQAIYPPPRRMHSATRNPSRGVGVGARYPYASDGIPLPAALSSATAAAPSDARVTTTTTGAASHQRQESEATIFKVHPGEEVLIDRSTKIRSEDLDAWFVRSASR